MGRLVTLLLGASLIVGACSSSEALPAPATREITETTPSPVTTAVTAVTVVPVITDDGSVFAPTPTSTTEPPAADDFEFEIDWAESADGVDTGTIAVPLDYADPQGKTIDLYVARHRAAATDDRIGILFVNNGGPGSPASSMAVQAGQYFAAVITDRFDVIAWDPRGTGRSGGSVDCIDDDEYDRFYAEIDITPDDAAEKDQLVSLAEEFADRCVEQVGPSIEYIGTNNSARDMDALRQALGEVQASYFGFSYGSELGATWATLFPTTVRAAVLDGAADPTADDLESTRQQWIGFEASLNTFLAQCSANPSCAFHNDGNSEAAFDALMLQLDAEPLAGPLGRPDVNLGVAVIGVARAMYNDQFWTALARSLNEAQNGDGAGLLALQDAYYQRSADGSYSNLLESFQAIICADDARRPTIEEADADALTLIGVAPRLFPYTTGSYACTFFPPSRDPRVDITGVGAGPIVVIGTTGDPSTPLDSSRKMSTELEDGRLVVVEANQHTGYRVNSCVDDVVHDYLVQLTAPVTETVCA